MLGLKIYNYPNKYVVFFHLETVIIKGFTNITLIR